MTDPAATPLQTEDLVAQARELAGLQHLGPQWILESLGAYVDALRTEADLTADGAIYTAEIIIRSLVNRLRMMEAIRLHPEILEEDLKVLAAIIGLPRTGSTLLQRILASVPGINGVRWWELQNFAPFPGEVSGQPLERVRFAEAMVAEWLAATPEFAAIHPLSATQVDEESVLLHNMFCGLLEFRAPIPSYMTWLNGADLRNAYADLRTTLKFLQWQEPSRRGKPWVLKAPEHMIAPEVLLATFPDSKVIVTHRNPVQVLPSICSMHYTIQRLTVAHPDRLKIGRANLKFWGPTLEKFTALRERIGDARFIDIGYRDLLQDPVGEAQKTLAALGMSLDAQGEAAIKNWLAENAREQRASHSYSAEEFGLTGSEIENSFAHYISRFIAA